MVKTTPEIPACKPTSTSLRALDAANFFLADVRDGLGPYLAIYLLATRHWNAQDIGIAMSLMGIATVVAQTPAGILVDRTRRKRLLSIVASLLIASASLLTILWPRYEIILSGQIIMGFAAAWFVPAVAAITLGLVGPKALDNRIGRNETFNHAGNVVAAVLAGLVGYYVKTEGIFVLLALMSLLSSVSLWRIREDDIDHEVARGKSAPKKEGEQEDNVTGIRAVMKNRSILFFCFGLCLIPLCQCRHAAPAGPATGSGN